jgi:hypothetical protein
MPIIPVTGALPGSISEAANTWEWIGNLQVSVDPALINFVDLIGSGANIFDAAFHPGLGLITVTMLGRVDYEYFTALGIAPELSLQLRFFMGDGTIAYGGETYQVAVLNVDDTPPEALWFATGGTVPANQAGAAIGSLGVTDPDTASGFAFSLQPDDDGTFEIVGGVLKLRAGVALPAADVPQRSLIIEVSDGTNASAHTLTFNVTNDGPNTPDAPHILAPGEQDRGFSMPDADHVRIERGPWDIASMTYRDGVIEAVLPASAGSVFFDKPQWIDMPTGQLDFRAESEAFQIWAIYDAIAGRDPTPAELALGVRLMQGGFSEQALVSQMLYSSKSFRISSFTAESYVQELFKNAVGWELPATDVTVREYADRITLDTGLVAVTQEIIDWAREMPEAKQRLEEGFWVPRAFGAEAAALIDIGTGRPMDGAVWSLADLLAGAGTTLQAAAQTLAGTPEFQARFGALSDADFVSEMFRRVLQHEPDTSGLNEWVAQLDSGVSRTEVFFSFATSPEAQAFYGAAPHLDFF